jgi:hypothetical protein
MYRYCLSHGVPLFLLSPILVGQKCDNRAKQPKTGAIQGGVNTRIKGGAIIDHVPPRERRLAAVEK